jgi:hypothetical protein
MITPKPDDIVNFFQIVNAGLTENPPPADESDLMMQFKKINVGPNQKFSEGQLKAEEKQIWLDAVKDGFQEMRKMLFARFKILNGWALNPPHMGDFGDDYLYRAYVALTGLGGVVPEEAIYLPKIRAKDDPPLSGQNRYLLHFSKDNLPPVAAFWSLSMYEVAPDRRQYFTRNPIDRFSIGNLTDGLKYQPDGSLDIYIQHQSPGLDRESNWLPAPEGRFSMIIRAFQPDQSIICGDYGFPEIRILDAAE